MSEKTNPIQDFFSDKESGSGTELFRVSEENVDIKTEVTATEARLVNVLMSNDDFLESKGIRRVYKNYYSRFLRLQISLDRKGRSEFVQINRKDNSDDTISKLGNLQNVLGARK